MGRLGLAWMIAAAVAAAACKRTPAAAPPAAPRAADAAVAPAATREARVLGAPLSLSADTQSDRPQVVADARGSVFAAWFEAGSVLVKRWSGSAWEPLGGAVNQGLATGPFALVSGPDGAPVVAWANGAGANGDEVRVARWSGTEWTLLGGPLTDPSQGLNVSGVAATFAGDALFVAVGQRRGDSGTGGLRVARWRDDAWTVAGPPSLTLDHAMTVAVAATTCEDGSVVLAWVESAPNAPPTLQTRRWDPQANTWAVIPRGNAPTVDGTTTTLAIAPATGAEFYLAYGWHHGLHALVRWSVEATDWADLGFPQDSLRRSAIDAGPFLSSRGSSLLYAWRTRGGRLSAARLAGRAWTPVGASLDTATASAGALAQGPRGSIFAAFVDRAGGKHRVTVSALDGGG